MRIKLMGVIYIVILFTLSFLMIEDYQAQSSDQSRNVIFYAHYDDSLPSIDKKILTTQVPGESIRTDNATIEKFFTLYPSVGSNLAIDGSVIFRAYLQAEQNINGRLIYTIYEVLPNGNRTVITKSESYIAVTPTVDGYTFGVAGIKYIIKSGSTIQMGILFTPTILGVPTYLLWDSVKTPTQVVISFLNHIKVKISAHNNISEIENFFSLDETSGFLGLTLRANITDPFGIQDIKSANISIVDSEGRQILEEVKMEARTIGAGLYQAVYEHNVTLPQGIHNIIVNIIDTSGNSHVFQNSIGITYFHNILINVKDGEGNSIPNKQCDIINSQLKLETSYITNASGFLKAYLPSSNVVGEYNLMIRWENYTFNIPFSVSKLENGQIDLHLPIYNFNVKVLFYYIPLPGANVSLFRGSEVIANKLTGWNGSVSFQQLPSDQYNIRIDYLFESDQQEINLDAPQEMTVQIKNRYMTYILGLGFIAIIGGLLVVIIRRQDKPKKHPFAFINKIIEGGLPYEASIMISGPPASGKSVLISNMIDESLKKDRKCVYIVNIDFPSKIREDLKNLDVDVKKYEKKKRLIFIDCYSGVAGKESSEHHHVDSASDLTRIGIELSLCLEKLGQKTDIYFDSLSTALATLKPEQIVTFLHTTGAKVKGFSGRLCFTVGADIGKEMLAKVDEASDCIIELAIQRTNHAVQRMLRIKKVRGRWHSIQWVQFLIEKKKGIVFYTSKKIFKKSDL